MIPIIHSGLPKKEFWQLALKEIMASIKTALKKQGTVRLGLAGGRTPKHLYELLAEQKLPWNKMQFIVLDERCVPESDPESNLGMMKIALFNQTPDAKITAYNTELPPEEAAEQMARALIALSDQRSPLFDLLILGAGKDGHIASLFEDDPTLNTTAYASVAHAKGYSTELRLTATLLALQSSSKALLLLQGEEKRPVLAALKGAKEPHLTALCHLLEEMPLTVLTDFSA